MQIATWRDDLKISPDYRPWDSLGEKIAGLPAATDRVRAIINMVVAEKIHGLRKRTKKSIKKQVKDTIIDLSQNPCRKNFTTSAGVAHTMCASAHLVHLGQSRMILPREMLWLQGHNSRTTKIPEFLSPEDLRRLSGEGMALPCLGVCIWGLYLLRSFAKDVQ